MDFGLYEMKIVRNNPSSVKSDPRLTRTNDLSPLGSDLSEVYCIYIYKGVTHVEVAAGFLSRYLSDALPYMEQHVTIIEMC